VPTIEERYGVRAGYKFYRCRWCDACICRICFGHILFLSGRVLEKAVHVPDCADMPKTEHEPLPVQVKSET